MKRSLVAMLAGAMVLVVSAAVLAAESCIVVINYEVTEINAIDTNVEAVSLTVNSATAGSPPDAATDNSTVTYMLTSNGGTDAHKINGYISTDLGAGLTLEVALAAPTGATSLGAKQMDDVVIQDLVTDIDSLYESDLQVSFSLTATVTVAPVADSTTLTLTIVNT